MFIHYVSSNDVLFKLFLEEARPSNITLSPHRSDSPPLCEQVSRPGGHGFALQGMGGASGTRGISMFSAAPQGHPSAPLEFRLYIEKSLY